MKGILIILGILVLALSACAPKESAEVTVTGNSFVQPQVLSEKEVYEPTLREYEVRLQKITEDGTQSGELEEEAFFPETFIARAGDTVKLNFLFDEPRFISIEDFSIAENVQSGTLEFVVEKEGTYSMLCLDCEGTPDAFIVVN